MLVDLAAMGELTWRFHDALFLVGFGLFLFKAFVFVDALTRRKDAFPAAGKQSKGFWLIILGLAVVVDWVFGFNLVSVLPVAGLIAAIVYAVDVRPAVKQVSPPRGQDGNRRNMGPYGPW
mgnify:CR=1 FL=1